MKPALLIVLGVVLLVLTGCGPSCSDRGGTSVFSHFQTSVISTGKSTIVTQVPIYDCEMP